MKAIEEESRERPVTEYKILVFENAFPSHPLELDMMIQAHLPDGNILYSRILENMENCPILPYGIEFVSARIAEELLKGIQQDLQSRIAESISEKLKRCKL